MGAFGIWQWLVVLAVVLILFARPGKISGIMGDFGKGLRSFKTGMKGDGADAALTEAEEAEMVETVIDQPVEAETVRAKAPAKKAQAKKTTAKKKAGAKKAKKAAKK